MQKNRVESSESRCIDTEFLKPVASGRRLEAGYLYYILTKGLLLGQEPRG